MTMSNERTILADRLASLVRAFPERRVLVVGDMVADQFVFGEISRVSREAPVLILRHERTEAVPGGAANCAMNLASLGARAAIVGVVGDDAAGHALLEKLTSAGVDCEGVVVAPKLRTTTKQRVLAGHSHAPRQQVIRLDYENEPLSDGGILKKIVRNVRERFEETDAVIVSDYNYGVACKETSDALLALAANEAKPLLLDSRYRLSEFEGFTTATPNEDEVEHVAGRRLTSDEELETEAARLRERLGYDALLVTRGKHGMLLVERGAEPLALEAIGSHDAVDVTGAGDTVIAAFALALASGAGYTDAARLANHAGGIVVLKRGTACVYPHELFASLLQEGE